MVKRVARFLLLVLTLVSVGLATGAVNGAPSVPYCVDGPLYAQPHCYATAAEAAQDHGESTYP